MKRFLGFVLAAALALAPASAQSPQVRAVLLGARGVGAAAAPTTTTWNPSDKAAQLTLSPGNLIVTQNADPGTAVGVRGIASHSTGKFYYEVVITVANNLGLVLPGMETASAVLNDVIWASTNGVGYQPNSGNVVINGAVIGTAIQTSAIGDTICIAVDIANAAIWVRTNAGNWNNSGTANPATNTGGISLATLAAGPYFPGISTRATGDSATANFGGSAYAQSVPAGFGNW